MSWGLATSSLYVVCKDAEQAAALEKKFENERDGDDLFILWTTEKEPLKLFFDLVDGEVPSTFDDDVLELNQWLKNNFDLTLAGSWCFDADGEWRCEVKDGQIIDASLDWLAEYSVEQIHKIRKWAEEQFLTKSAS